MGRGTIEFITEYDPDMLMNKEELWGEYSKLKKYCKELEKELKDLKRKGFDPVV
jgi:hypothetical protein